MKYEPESGKALTRIPDFRAYLASMSINPESELKAVCEYLGLDDPMYDLLRDDLEQWVELFFDRIETPPNDANWTGKLPPGGAPMMSLRDVEEQAPVVGTTGS